MYTSFEGMKINSKLEAKKYALQLATKGGCNEPVETDFELAQKYYDFMVDGLNIPDVDLPLAPLTGMMGALAERMRGEDYLPCKSPSAE